jgi:MFS family permease
MSIQNQRRQLAGIYHEYPRPFWTLIGVTFIDRLGGALLFPFFALYITSKFGVGMTQVGMLFAVFSISSFIGSFLGGALTDRMGRKGLLIFSLITSSLSAVALGLVDSLEAFFILAIVVGILTDTGGPAYQAMVADLLPEEKRTQGYGIIRVAANLAFTIGPAIGGLLASRSYLLLFIADAIISLISAGIVFFYLPETKPEVQPGAPSQSLGGTFRGYLRVFQDKIFMMFIAACVLMGLVYMNMHTTLGVYLRDIHDVPEAGYGVLLSMNALLVVVFQFPITRRIKGKPPMLMMALGTTLYAIGFVMYGFVTAFAMFLLAMVVITLGEMLVAPVSQALTAKMAPVDMRGRYMAVFGFSWGIPFAVGPILAGLIIDNADPRLLWFAAGLVGILAVAGFLWLYRLTEAKPAPVRAQASD